MQAARADRPAAPAEGQETLNFPSTPTSGPPLELTNQPGTYFF